MGDHKEIIKQLIDFRNARDWNQFHTKENLAKSIAIEAGELLAHFQWGDPVNDGELAEELADILIYAYLLADKLGVDPLEVMRDKLKINEKRFPVKKVKGTSGKMTRIDKG